MSKLLLLKAAFEYVELSTVIAVLVVIICALVSLQISARRPLYYNLFVVEMHTWTTRRMVQVLHLGQEFTPAVSWDRLVQRMRARAPRIQGEQRIAISDTNIVIQSPNTVIDSPAPARSPDVDLITLWDIEMPPPMSGHQPDATRDSHYAAAAAIAILARGAAQICDLHMDHLRVLYFVPCDYLE
uniref:Transmembrane protein n=1 Tax=Caenorhabditis tropicalis TaxID=1561998 RepID=A0A1I7TL56_9PELO